MSFVQASNTGSVNRPQLQSVEAQTLSQPAFEQALDTAFNDAELLWSPLRRGRTIEHGMATITGEVAINQPFRIVIDQNQYLILMGFRTRYTGSDICKMQIIADGMVMPPFILDSSIRYTVFDKPIIWRPDKQFQMVMLNGEGRLQFVCIGATVYKRGFGFGHLIFNISENEKVGEEHIEFQERLPQPTDLQEETSDPRTRAFIKSWEKK
jgi:hypothetical protein